MKRELRTNILVLLTAAFVTVITGCQTLQPPGIVMEPLDKNHGGGGGGES